MSAVACWLFCPLPLPAIVLSLHSSHIQNKSNHSPDCKLFSDTHRMKLISISYLTSCHPSGPCLSLWPRHLPLFPSLTFLPLHCSLNCSGHVKLVPTSEHSFMLALLLRHLYVLLLIIWVFTSMSFSQSPPSWIHYPFVLLSFLSSAYHYLILYCLSTSFLSASPTRMQTPL